MEVKEKRSVMITLGSINQRRTSFFIQFPLSHWHNDKQKENKEGTEHICWGKVSEHVSWSDCLLAGDDND